MNTRIKKARRALDLTQQEFAKKLEVLQMYSHIMKQDAEIHPIL